MCEYPRGSSSTPKDNKSKACLMYATSTAQSLRDWGFGKLHSTNLVRKLTLVGFLLVCSRPVFTFHKPHSEDELSFFFPCCDSSCCFLVGILAYYLLPGKHRCGRLFQLAGVVKRSIDLAGLALEKSFIIIPRRTVASPVYSTPPPSDTSAGRVLLPLSLFQRTVLCCRLTTRWE